MRSRRDGRSLETPQTPLVEKRERRVCTFLSPRSAHKGDGDGCVVVRLTHDFLAVKRRRAEPLSTSRCLSLTEKSLRNSSWYSLEDGLTRSKKNKYTSPPRGLRDAGCQGTRPSPQRGVKGSCWGEAEWPDRKFNDGLKLDKSTFDTDVSE